MAENPLQAESDEEFFFLAVGITESLMFCNVLICSRGYVVSDRDKLFSSVKLVL